MNGYVVDTNVWSELLKPMPDRAVVSWFDANHDALRMPVTVAMELLYGISRLPAGSREARLRSAVFSLLDDAAMHLLPYSLAAADEHAGLRASLEARGFSASAEDLQIAAIAKATGRVVATRNVRDFEAIGVATVDPCSQRPVRPAP